MTWKTFRRIAVSLNLIVLIPLWAMWISNHVTTEPEQFFVRILLSVGFSIAVTFTVFLIVHLISFFLKRLRGEEPIIDHTASAMRIMMLGLLLVGVSGFLPYLIGWNVPAPISAVSSASLLILMVLLASGHWVIALKEVIEFKAFK